MARVDALAMPNVHFQMLGVDRSPVWIDQMYENSAKFIYIF